MNVHNMTFDERVREASRTDNTLALSLIEDFDKQLAEHTEQLDELKSELVDHYVDKIEADFEAHFEEYYDNPESDYWTDLDYLVTESDFTDRLKQAMEYCINRDENSDHLPHIELFENNFDHCIELLANDIAQDVGSATSIEKSHMYSSRYEYSIFDYPVGEHSDETEHYIENASIPEAILEQVKERVGDVIYQNSDSLMSWVLDLEWLENWLNENKDNLKGE
jgi:predicted component of type VI protein secretion system